MQHGPARFQEAGFRGMGGGGGGVRERGAAVGTLSLLENLKKENVVLNLRT